MLFLSSLLRKAMLREASIGPTFQMIKQSINAKSVNVLGVWDDDGVILATVYIVLFWKLHRLTSQPEMQ
jgi:hypothetical protein